MLWDHLQQPPYINRTNERAPDSVYVPDPERTINTFIFAHIYDVCTLSSKLTQTVPLLRALERPATVPHLAYHAFLIWSERTGQVPPDRLRMAFNAHIKIGDMCSTNSTTS